MDENSVDVTLTSPPYYDLKDYKDPRQIGLGQSYESYKSDLTRIFSDVLRVTKDTGSLWVVVDNLRIKGKLTLLPLEMAEWIRSCGWILQDVLVWDKIKSRPVIRGLGLRKVYEHILVFSKKKNFKRHLERVRNYELTQWWVKWPERYKSAGKAPSDIWSFLIPSQGNWSRWPIFKYQKLHECPFPPDLVEQVLLLSTDEDDMVLDPFAGSGMTLAVANCMKRNFTGFEVSGEYLRNFWDQLMPVIRHWYQEKNAQMLLSPDDIEERLEKLKKLKFARTLSQKLIAEVPAFRPASTFVLQKDDKIDVHLLYDDSVKPLDGSIEALANKIVQGLLQSRDLKTFGVDARTQVLSARQFVGTMKDSLNLTPLWLYKRHHMWESSTKFDEWAARYNDEGWKERYFMGKSPPLVSNIDIFQKIVDLRKPSSTD
ncbi:MAG TPA: site-specific DNA-methyltransferase [Candidatus Bathyarchaeia archaeon]|nr:site-specific DNA-methyltransferase [Candidatus Bathyarchaeia archaeon]